MKRKPQVYDDALTYLAAFGDDYRGPAVVSRTMAAEALGVSRATVEGMLKRGQLAGTTIAGVLCVNVESLCEKVAVENGRIAIVTKYLETQALVGQPTVYGPVMAAIGLSTTIPADRRKIGQTLDAVSRRTLATLRATGKPEFLLSALVHKKSAGESMPSEGFYNLAEAAGFKVTDRSAFVAAQLAAIYKHYRKRGALGR